MVQLLVLAVLSQDNKDMKVQDQDSGLAWELEEYQDICLAAIGRVCIYLTWSLIQLFFRVLCFVYSLAGFVKEKNYNDITLLNQILWE